MDMFHLKEKVTREILSQIIFSFFLRRSCLSGERASVNIEGLKFAGHTVNILAHADNAYLFKLDVKSLHHALNKSEEFVEYSSLKFNIETGVKNVGFFVIKQGSCLANANISYASAIISFLLKYANFLNTIILLTENFTI